jgi:3-hydroxyacyl-CoA dehydrogenase
MKKLNKKIGVVGSGKMGMQLGILMGINEYTVLIYSFLLKELF